MFLSLFGYLVLIISSLICVAFFTLLERKVLGVIGSRLGPFKVSLGGVLQPIGDAGKLLNKETNSLSNFSYLFYYGSSFLMLFFSLTLFSILSIDVSSLSFKMGLLIILIILGLNSLNSILCGWSTYSKFSLLGSLRTVSQLVSYEVPLYICLFFIISLCFSFDLFIINQIGIPLSLILPYLFFFWFICVLAELNRSPYDFSEGESELVSGFNVEFGSSSFTMIFLAEYGFIFFFMVFSSLLFLSYFSLLWIFLFFSVLWIRSVLPRYRFDKLMGLSWKVIIPQLGFILLVFFLYII